MNSFFNSSHHSFPHEGSPAYERFDFNVDFEAADHMFKTGCEKFMNSVKNPSQMTSPFDLPNLESHTKDYLKPENLTLSPLLSTWDSDHHSEETLSNQTVPEIEKPAKAPKKKTLKRKLTEDSDSNLSNEAPANPNAHQNQMKNHQGTFCGKIKKLCHPNKETGEDSRLFRIMTFDLTPDQREAFRKWAMTYKKANKTWKKLKDFMSSPPQFGVLFANMMIFLFTETFKDEYEECIREGSMSEKNKVLLREQASKDFFIYKFTLIRDELLGFANGFEHNIKVSREKQKKIKV